jgi:hypothetical protein
MYALFFKKICVIPILLTFFTIIFGNTSLFSLENSFAHDFSSDESAQFLTIVDKIKVESELAANSSDNNNLSLAQLHANNNLSLAQLHANNALLNYDSHTKDEISERNERIANELDDTLNQLLKEVKSQTDQSQLTYTVETITAILEEAISTRIDEEQLNNSTIQALVLANIVDTALQNYGDAYNVGIDLTNMSNMIKDTTTNDTTTNGHIKHGSTNVSMHSNIVNSTNYESALGFSNNALDKYYNEISTSSPQLSEENNNNITSQNYLEKLENELIEFNNAIKNKDNPIKVMKIVHTQIHPNLQILFNLKIG